MNLQMTSRRFRAQDRLRTSADFERVFERRCSASDDLLLVYVRENDRGHSRLGLSVSRKVGGAVVRNRWKRLLRESFRLSREELPVGVDIIAIPRTEAEPQLRPLMASLLRLAARASARLERPS